MGNMGSLERLAPDAATVRPLMVKVTPFLLFLLAGAGEARTILGPNKYTRTGGPPDVYTDQFTAPPDVEPGWTIVIFNGEADGTNRLSSASLKINGVELAPSDFSQRTYRIEKDITSLMHPLNDVLVRLAGGPGGYLHATVASATSGKICLTVTKDPNGKDVHLDWLGGNAACPVSGGGPNFTAVRSTSVLFGSGNARLQQNLPPQFVSDVGTLTDGKNYFYLVGDGSADDPTPGGRAFSACPPRIAALVNLTRTGNPVGEGFDGETVRIDGACDPFCNIGECFDLTAAKNLVTFNDERATVTSSTGTSLTVVVPPRVTTGPVTVFVNGLRSNALPFTVVVPTGTGLTLQDISSMFAYAVPTDPNLKQKLYVADRGTNNRIYRLDFTATPPTVFTGPALSNVIMSSKDNDGNVVFVGGLESCTNKGILRRWDQDISVQTNWRTVGCTDCALCPLPLEPIFTKAIAVDPTTPPLCSPACPDQTRTALAVARTVCNLGCSANAKHTVYEFPGKVGLLDKDYGNTQGTSKQFNFPIGGGGGGPVSGAKFNADGSILYITNGTELRSISADDVNAVKVVASGFTSLAGIDIRETAGIKTTYVLAADRGAGAVYLINVRDDPSTREVVATGLNSPRAVAFADDPTTHKTFYYVAEQNRIIRLPDSRLKLAPQLVDDGKVMISVRLDDPDDYPLRPLQLVDRIISLDFEYLPHPFASVTVYMRVIDPAADTVYGSPAVDDNAGTPRLGTLATASVTVGINGRPFAPVDFTITDKFAGDNYRIEFSEEDFSTNSNARVIARTGILTAWKRVYAEADPMYKLGSLLNQNWSSTTPNIVVVQDVSDFTLAGGDPVLVLDAAKVAGEPAVVAPNGVNLATKEITLDRNLTGPFTTNNFAGIVRTTPTPATFNLPDYGLWHDCYEEDTFVEYRELPEGSHAVPHTILDVVGNPNKTRDFGVAYFTHANQFNYVFLCSADADMTATILGESVNDNNVSYVFDGRISTLSNPAAKRRDVNVHEWGHQWKVNQVLPSDSGEDTNQALEGTDLCIMNTNRNRDNDDADFDIIGGFAPLADVYGVRDGQDGLQF